MCSSSTFLMNCAGTRWGPHGAIGQTYGIVGDRDGNGYWSQMAFDTIVKANLAH